MKERIVSFEIAKLAKEKGFGCGSKNHYCVYQVDLKEKRRGDVELIEAAYELINNESCTINYHFILYEAPTQSLLQKWIRDVHKIHIEIIFNYDLKYFSKRVYGCNTGEKYDKYEEALESGLLMALNQIKNIKQ